MAPPPGSGRMGGCETTPPDRTREPPSEPPPGNHNPAGPSSPPIIGHRLPASSSFVLARAPHGRSRCGRSSLTHGPRGGTKPAATGKASKTVPHTKPGHTQHVTGPAHHALLTEGPPWVVNLAARVITNQSAAHQLRIGNWRHLKGGGTCQTLTFCDSHGPGFMALGPTTSVGLAVLGPQPSPGEAADLESSFYSQEPEPPLLRRLGTNWEAPALATGV
jgi:hypothetical protein